MAITRLVEVDGLEHMMIERHVGWKLTLIVGTVKAHFKFGTILWVLPDVVHGTEVFPSISDTRGLVGSVECLDSNIIAIEVLIVFLHIGRIVVSNGDVVTEFCRAKNSSFFPGSGFA